MAHPIPKRSIEIIDQSRRSVRLSRHQVRNLFKQIAERYCSAAIPVTVKSSLSLLSSGLGDPRKAPELAALLSFAQILVPGCTSAASQDDGEDEYEPPVQTHLVEDSWGAL
jgi:hypothetical protein